MFSVYLIDALSRPSLCVFFFQAEDGIRYYKVTGFQTCALPISFFFQAEDGIRDYKVTGVQTCALPISVRHPALSDLLDLLSADRDAEALRVHDGEDIADADRDV